MSESKSLLQPVDDASRALARRLIRSARHAALGVWDAVSEWPSVSRTALATDIDGCPIILVSALSAHTQALLRDPKCSLLLGEPGKGDPLAHPRITLLAKAQCVSRDEVGFDRVRRRYLSRLPKAALYADFGDFSFWRIQPERASLNGGFGRAFELSASDVLTSVENLHAFSEVDVQACEHMNQHHASAVSELACGLGRAQPGDWQMVTMDPHGLEMSDSQSLIRIEFGQIAQTPEAVHQALRDVLTQTRSRATDSPSTS